MKTWAILGWLTLPVVATAYHFGPGQDRVKLDATAIAVQAAESAIAIEDWTGAIQEYDRAIAALPADRSNEAWRLRAERAKARMFAKQLPEASVEIEALVEELQADSSADANLLADVRLAHANAQYYLTWLMRLEGYGREEWEPEIESARQTYKLLADNAEYAGDSKGARARSEDLESAIRLARMTPGELQGLAIPKQCQGCKSGQCKKPGRSLRPGQNKPMDARGAGSGPPPDNSGS